VTSSTISKAAIARKSGRSGTPNRFLEGLLTTYWMPRFRGS
jgi:hypothetical protein